MSEERASVREKREIERWREESGGCEIGKKKETGRVRSTRSDPVF